MTSLPTQEQIWTNAADAADRAALALSDVRDWLRSDWSDTKPLTDEAVQARSAAYARLETLKDEIRDLEHQLRGGARSLRDRR
ncbi:hypothetical protein [Nocardia farcinica]|uniref:Uncharacterized protein n=1 Tax=Nocardia farcinica (strain IFM 10152) TaxID=247156 RepID=Q5YMQ2_NOCFA|nr:hypothetical protein [Nocardia farcinica]MBF6410872.1 hypothetical protein [Nocardia farcinica]UEX26018.1 hypothetical protein LMJ57_29670 [Nocardia farcinica]BAD60539.1 hypothetical protein PNF1_140 [Nocardia farcinica IFM 10152]